MDKSRRLSLLIRVGILAPGTGSLKLYYARQSDDLEIITLRFCGRIICFVRSTADVSWNPTSNA